jgi:hypothetical protein
MTDETRRATGAPLWKWMSEIGLESIDDSAIAQLLRQRRQVVLECLEELLQKGASTAERNAAASAIGTLTALQKKLTPGSR